MKQLTVRQAGLMLSFSMASIKFLVFPSIMSRFAGRDGYIASAIGFTIDMFLVGMILFTLKRFPDKSLKEIMTETYGLIVSKIVFIILCIYMYVKTVFIIKEAHTYFMDTLFDEIEVFMFIIPIVVISGYIASKNLKVLGRTIEIVFLAILIGILITAITPLQKMDFFSILPVMENGFGPVWEGVIKTSFAFGDPLILMLFLGKVRFSKGKASKIFLYAVITAIFIIILDIIFISLFEYIGVNERIAVIDIPLHSTNPMTIGRLDWITIILWIVTLIVQSGVFMHFSVESFSIATAIPNKWSTYILSVIVFITLWVFSFGLSELIEIVISPVFCSLILAVQILLPAMVFLAGIIQLWKKKVRKNEKIEENT